MSVDDVMKDDQPLNDTQINHIKGVMKILEKEPKLKSDIKRTITEELAKANMNTNEFDKYNEELEKLNIIQDAPIAVRGNRTVKPRAKKSAPVDMPIIPMDIETSSNLPKGNIKDNQKKKTKVITL